MFFRRFNHNLPWSVVAEYLLDESSMRYCCPNRLCSRSYKNKGSLSFHLKYECGKQPVYQCSVCRKLFHQKSNFTKHLKRVHRLPFSPALNSLQQQQHAYFSFPDGRSSDRDNWKSRLFMYLLAIFFQENNG